MSLEDNPSTTLLQELARLEAVAEPTSEAAVFDALIAVGREDESVRESPTYHAEAMAFGFHEASRDSNVDWGTYYGPTFSSITNEGKVAASPNLGEVTPAILEYWSERADATSAAMMRLRYLDLIWDFSPRVRGERADVEVARAVVDTTLLVVAARAHKYPTSMVKKMRRALDLTRGISDSVRVTAVAEAMLDYETAIGRDDHGGSWGFSFDSLVLPKRSPLNSDQVQGLVDDMEARLDRYSAGDPPEPHAAEQAAFRLRSYYRRKNDPEAVRRVLRAYGQAYVRAAESAEPLVAGAWLQDVFETFRKEGMNGEADELAPRLQALGLQASDGMTPVSVEVSVKNEEFEAVLRSLEGEDLYDSLDRIVGQFVTQDSDALAEEVRRIAEEAPFQAMLPSTILDREGRPTVTIGGVEDDLEGNIAKYASDGLHFDVPFLAAALDRLRERHGPTVDHLADYLHRSPLFAASRRGLLEVGLDAYLRGDPVASVHVLVPQIEAAARRVLELTGRPLYKQVRNGGLLLRTLDDVLRDPGVESALTARIALYMRVTLTDARGWNIRNRVCHGLVEADEFGRIVADRVLHALLVLGQTRATRVPG